MRVPEGDLDAVKFAKQREGKKQRRQHAKQIDCSHSPDTKLTGLPTRTLSGRLIHRCSSCGSAFYFDTWQEEQRRKIEAENAMDQSDPFAEVARATKKQRRSYSPRFHGDY